MGFISVFLIFASASFAYPKIQLNTPVIYIEVDPNPDKSVVKKPIKKYKKKHIDPVFYDDTVYELNYLRFRVRRLERAVRQLQTALYENKEERKQVVVYLKTPFDGTFIGKGKTRIEAIANAIINCEKGGGQGWCDERRIRK